MVLLGRPHDISSYEFTSIEGIIVLVEKALSYSGATYQVSLEKYMFSDMLTLKTS